MDQPFDSPGIDLPPDLLRLRRIPPAGKLEGMEPIACKFQCGRDVILPPRMLEGVEIRAEHRGSWYGEWFIFEDGTAFCCQCDDFRADTLRHIHPRSNKIG